ncbi:hypothetical protein AVEN_140879-1, partial [Araneus ventricosus]
MSECGFDDLSGCFKLDIHENTVPHYLDSLAKEGSNFKPIHVGGSFTGRTSPTANLQALRSHRVTPP